MPLFIRDVLDLCDKRRDLKKTYETERSNEYREANKKNQKAVKKATEDLIGTKSEEIETCLFKTNSKRAYHLLKDFTSEKQSRSSTIQYKDFQQMGRILLRTMQQ